MLDKSREFELKSFSYKRIEEGEVGKERRLMRRDKRGW